MFLFTKNIVDFKELEDDLKFFTKSDVFNITLPVGKDENHHVWYPKTIHTVGAIEYYCSICKLQLGWLDIYMPEFLYAITCYLVDEENIYTCEENMFANLLK